MTRYLILLLLSICSMQEPAGQKTPIEQMLGTWHTRGHSFGMPSDVHLTWETALEKKFYKISYKLLMHRDGKPDKVFEGVGYYKMAGNDSLTGSWFDSNGQQHPIRSKFEGNALKSTWGTASTELGKTVYQLIGSDRLLVIDSVQRKDGGWREFSRNTLNRIN